MIKGRYVLYKADEWSAPIYWQWYLIDDTQKSNWYGKTFFPYLLSTLENWERIYDTNPEETMIENMKYIKGFESLDEAMNFGLKRQFIQK